MKSTKRQIKKVELQEAGITSVEEHCVFHSKKNLQQAGITLLALVVTIIVLLILAGVTISLALNNNGVIERAQYASNTWANATKDERSMMEVANDKITELSNATGDNENNSPTTKTYYRVLDWAEDYDNQDYIIRHYIRGSRLNGRKL